MDDGYIRLKWLTPSAAARRKGVTAARIRSACDAGNIRWKRLGGGHRRIDPASLEEWVPMYRTHEAAEMLERSVDTIRKMYDAGELWGARTPKGQRLIHPDAIARVQGLT